MIERFHQTLSVTLRVIVHRRDVGIRLRPDFIKGWCCILHGLPHSGIQAEIPYERLFDRRLESLKPVSAHGAHCHCINHPVQ